MTDTFFDKGSKCFVYQKELEKNAIEQRETRISQAHTKMQQCYSSILTCMSMLKQLTDTIRTETSQLHQLETSHQQNPSTALTKEIDQLRHAIDEISVKLQTAKIEERIKQLSINYKKMRKELTEKASIQPELSESTAPQ